MKQFTKWFTCLLTVLMTGNAQENSGFEVSVSSGYVIPSSPMSFANYWKMQYGGALGAGIALTPSITIGGAFEYYQFTLDNNGINKGFDTKYMRDIWVFNDVALKPSANTSTVMTLAAQMRIAPPELSGSLSPYFLTGAGVMFFSLSEISLPVKSTILVGGSTVAMSAQQRIIGGDETIPFAQFGLGMNYRLTESFNVFIEARYTRGLNKGLGTTYLPLTAGIKYLL